MPRIGSDEIYRDMNHLISLVPSKRLLTLPAYFCENWLPHFPVEDIDILFCHFFTMDNTKANPDFPATEADRLRTLANLLKIASDKLDEPESDPRWGAVLISWHDMLINEDIGAGYPHETSAEGLANEATGEEGDTRAPYVGRVVGTGDQRYDVEEANPVDTVRDVPDLINFVNCALHKVEAGGRMDSILG
jgi:hypothetical protein